MQHFGFCFGIGHGHTADLHKTVEVMYDPIAVQSLANCSNRFGIGLAAQLLPFR